LADLEKGKEIVFSQKPGRRIFLFAIEGRLVVNKGEAILNRRDSARITQTPVLQLDAESDARFMLIDLP
jgi:quercetin 2,3-dioxygenase